jgi:hypothetical protein
MELQAESIMVSIGSESETVASGERTGRIENSPVKVLLEKIGI